LIITLHNQQPQMLATLYLHGQPAVKLKIATQQCSSRQRLTQYRAHVLRVIFSAKQLLPGIPEADNTSAYIFLLKQKTA
jgi:hypothetical protein